MAFRPFTVTDAYGMASFNWRKVKTDYRYSSGLVYNTFPVQNLSTQRKNEIARVMLDILDIREYEGGSLAELYNTKTMPKSLRQKARRTRWDY